MSLVMVIGHAWVNNINITRMKQTPGEFPLYKADVNISWLKATIPKSIKFT